MVCSSEGINPTTKLKHMTSPEKLISAQSIIADMSRLANETAEQTAARIAFFGEDCDKIAALARAAEKLVKILVK